jgi:hypothetical protein
MSAFVTEVEVTVTEVTVAAAYVLVSATTVDVVVVDVNVAVAVVLVSATTVAEAVVDINVAIAVVLVLVTEVEVTVTDVNVAFVVVLVSATTVDEAVVDVNVAVAVAVAVVLVSVTCGTKQEYEYVVLDCEFEARVEDDDFQRRNSGGWLGEVLTVCTQLEHRTQQNNTEMGCLRSNKESKQQLQHTCVRECVE